MFLFSCCTSYQSQYSYQIREQFKNLTTTNSFSSHLDKINSSTQYLIKVKRSDLSQTIKSNSTQKANDLHFPPSKQSLGNIPTLSTCNWKRLSEIVPHPTLFTTKKVKVKKSSQKSLTGDYFINGLSAILQEPRKIKDILVTQQISPNGIYLIKLRINGQIRQVIVDDYVPVNQIGQPLFMAPTHSEIWIPLVEKAWAKVNNSYANIMFGNTAELFKALNFAPSQIFYLQDKRQKKQKLWKLLTEAVQRKSPVSCLTSHSSSIDWIHTNLVPNYQYTLVLNSIIDLKLYAAEIFDFDEDKKEKKSYRMVKLRNSNSQTNWEGKGSVNDAQFWGKIMASQQKVKILEHINPNEGEFIMLYSDFIRYFEQIYISYQLKQGNFIWQEMFLNNKNGSFWEVDVLNDGQYFFELHQQSLRNTYSEGQEIQYGRSTIILSKLNGKNNYQFISGSMRFTQEDALVNACLKPGKYIIYAKVEIKNKSGSFNNKYSLSCYSSKLCKFRSIQKIHCQNFLQNIFLNYARQNKRQFYNKQNMWLSWKLLFKECGFAFIAFGNSKDSDKKFTVKFESRDFEQMHFKLKTPFKTKKDQQNTIFQLNILPGQEKIILARVLNDRVTTLKFPPQIEMKIEQLN